MTRMGAAHRLRVAGAATPTLSAGRSAPDGASWAGLLSASGTIERAVETATFDNSQISVGGAPFVSASARYFTLSL
jgi:hypothetical protein